MKARRLGGAILFVAVVSTLGASRLAPHAADEKFPGLLNAPPTMPHLRDDAGTWRAPFIYPWRRVSQLEQRYEEDRATPVSLTWLDSGRLVISSDEARAPLLLLGADSSGHDVFSRWNKEHRLWGEGPLWRALGIFLTVQAVCFGFLIFSGHLSIR